MSINKVVISGNLTRDPELRQTANGFPVLGFGVAVNDRRKNQQTGEWEDYPNFIDCTMFGARAESVSRFLSKGSKVAIEGKLRWSQWERDGQKRSKIEVVVDENRVHDGSRRGRKYGHVPHERSRTRVCGPDLRSGSRSPRGRHVCLRRGYSLLDLGHTETTPFKD